MRSRTPSNTVADLRRRVEHALGELVVDGGKHIVAAVSGGVDSVAMLDLLLSLREKHHLTIAVAHFNHQLRSSSVDDARFVKRLAAKHKLEFITASANIAALAAQHGTSTEMAGRDARYNFFSHILETTTYSSVATAHTRSDNAETVILNLVRGGGINTLAGIPPVRPIGKKCVIRPLLDIDKDELLRYATSRRLTWREDHTNRNIDIPRNRVRHAILPELAALNPRVTEAIQRSSEITRSIIQYVRPDIDHAKESLVKRRIPGESVSIAIQPLKGYFGFLQSIALHEILRDTFPDVLFGAADIDRVIELTERQTGNRAHIVGSLVALRDRSAIAISRSPNAPVGSTSLVIESTARIGDWTISARVYQRNGAVPKSSRSREFVDADRAGSHFLLRPWQPGDAFVPLGMTSRKKISDFLTDAKVPSASRRSQLVMIADEQIIWVCGQRIDDRVRVTDRTTRLLKLSMSRAK